MKQSQYHLKIGFGQWVFKSLLTAVFMTMLGCAMMPQKVFIKDTSKSFHENTIISTKTGRPVSFEELMTDLIQAEIIYIGERHTNLAHHDVQLKIIEALYSKQPAISLCMEMFDRTYQEVLDSWSRNELDRGSFLKKTHWYANWKFDFDLYGNIFDFVKEKNIRWVGLNIPFHIPPKIAVGGIENLRYGEKKYLPQSIDTSNTAHREYVEKIFNEHHVKGRENFDDFYQAQCVWEEAMAESIALNLKENKMIVLIGNGHIIKKFGVPDRAFKRTNAPFRTVFQASPGSTAELSFADYIWVTPSNRKTKMGQ